MWAGLLQTLVLVVARRLAGRSAHRDVLHRDAVRGDVVNLTRRGHVDQIIGLHLDLVSRRQEGVETHNEVGMAFEELGHTADHSGRVYTVVRV